MRAAYLRKPRPGMRVGQHTIPPWAVLLAGFALMAAAGQAVGPVLSGSISGGAPVTVSQGILLDTAVPLGNNPGFGNQNSLPGEANEPSDGISARAEDGTSFTVAMEVHTGQRATVNIYLANKSGADAAAVLEMSVPQGFSVGLADIDRPGEGGSNVNASGGPILGNAVREAQVGPASWLLAVGASAGTGSDDGVTLLVQPQPNISPGFYTITGRITQIAGRLPSAGAGAATETANASPTARGPSASAAAVPAAGEPIASATGVAAGAIVSSAPLAAGLEPLPGA